MKVIGITGGVGAGKSEVLDIIDKNTNSVIIKSDELAKSLEAKGEVCYAPLVELLSEKILDDDLNIIPSKMAKAIFESDDKTLLDKVNEIIHPRVKERILSLIEQHKSARDIDYFFIEAALLIEDHYDLICDELWYIYADIDVRKKRLKESRNYSEEKITAIMNSQLDEATFRKFCKVVIDNSKDLEDTKKQLFKALCI